LKGESVKVVGTFSAADVPLRRVGVPSKETSEMVELVLQAKRKAEKEKDESKKEPFVGFELEDKKEVIRRRESLRSVMRNKGFAVRATLVTKSVKLKNGERKLKYILYVAAFNKGEEDIENNTAGKNKKIREKKSKKERETEDSED
jgi:hypothetical protein